MVIRVATTDDIPVMMRIRAAVRENRLVSKVIDATAYEHHLHVPRRTWVATDGDRVVGFAAGDRETANIWALFVDPDAEHRGAGRALHDAMIAWMLEACPKIWLTTEPGTRAEAFYRRAGWRETGREHGEIRFERYVART